jgi:competence protein ComEC
MAPPFIVFLIVLLYPNLVASDRWNEMVVWNVGQGQWLTHIQPHSCDHFDMGGEFATWSEVIKACGDRPNRLFLSHWDSDHIGFIPKAKRLLPEICLAVPPKGGPPSIDKRMLLKDIPSCLLRDSKLGVTAIQTFSLSNEDPPLANASHVFVVDNKWLIPGDSPQREERIWLNEPLPFDNIDRLILGHHGSRTSTSAQLLRRLVHLKVAVTSARRYKFGHPHRQTVQKLHKLGIEPLRTEDFGNVRWREGPRQRGLKEAL